MFLRQMEAVFLLLTRPDSSMAKPAAIHITRAPVMRKEKVLNMNWVSAETSARAGPAIAARAAVKPSTAQALPSVVVFTVMFDPPDRTVCRKWVVSCGGADHWRAPHAESIPRTVPTGRLVRNLGDFRPF